MVGPKRGKRAEPIVVRKRQLAGSRIPVVAQPVHLRQALLDWQQGIKEMRRLMNLSKLHGKKGIEKEGFVNREGVFKKKYSSGTFSDALINWDREGASRVFLEFRGNGLFDYVEMIKDVKTNQFKRAYISISRDAERNPRLVVGDIKGIEETLAKSGFDAKLKSWNGGLHEKTADISISHKGKEVGIIVLSKWHDGGVLSVSRMHITLPYIKRVLEVFLGEKK